MKQSQSETSPLDSCYQTECCVCVCVCESITRLVRLFPLCGPMTHGKNSQLLLAQSVSADDHTGKTEQRWFLNAVCAAPTYRL